MLKGESHTFVGCRKELFPQKGREGKVAPYPGGGGQHPRFRIHKGLRPPLPSSPASPRRCCSGPGQEAPSGPETAGPSAAPSPGGGTAAAPASGDWRGKPSAAGARLGEGSPSKAEEEGAAAEGSGKLGRQKKEPRRVRQPRLRGEARKTPAGHREPTEGGAREAALSRREGEGIAAWCKTLGT